MSLLALGVGRIASGEWKTGTIAALGVLGLFYLAAFANLLFVRQFSWVDVFLPVPFAVVWAVFMLPITLLVSAGFNSAECIGAGFLLTIALWFVKWGEISPRYLIFPVLVLLYEMIPVDIPGPFDEAFSFGGAIANNLLAGLRVYSSRQVREALGEPLASQPELLLPPGEH